MAEEDEAGAGAGSSVGYFAAVVALTASVGVLTACVVYAAYHYISSGEQIVRLILK